MGGEGGGGEQEGKRRRGDGVGKKEEGVNEWIGRGGWE